MKWSNRTGSVRHNHSPCRVGQLLIPIVQTEKPRPDGEECCTGLSARGVSEMGLEPQSAWLRPTVPSGARVLGAGRWSKSDVYGILSPYTSGNELAWG